MAREHVHDENCKPKTAVQEAIIKLAEAGMYAETKLKSISWYRFYSIGYLRGVVFGLSLACELLLKLNDKYNNDDGQLN